MLVRQQWAIEAHSICTTGKASSLCSPRYSHFYVISKYYFAFAGKRNAWVFRPKLKIHPFATDTDKHKGSGDIFKT